MVKKEINKDIINEEIKEKSEKMKKGLRTTIGEYKEFAMKGNIIDMAIGVVIGGAFTNIVNSVVNTTLTPLIGLLTNKVDLSSLFISLSGVHYDTLAQAQEAGALTWNYGALLNAILNFLIVSFTLFFIVKYMKNASSKMSKESEEKKEETTKECPYCFSQIPIKATRCAHCTSELTVENKKSENKKG